MKHSISTLLKFKRNLDCGLLLELAGYEKALTDDEHWNICFLFWRLKYRKTPAVN